MHDYKKPASLKLAVIEPVNRRFGYKVTFQLEKQVPEVTGNLSVIVQLAHGKRRTAPDVDKIEKEARERIEQALGPLAPK